MPAPPSSAITTLVVIVAVVLVILALLGWTAFSFGRVRFEVSSEGLRIRGGVYGRMNPRADLAMDRAQPLDLTVDTDHRLSWRTNGLGLPGYAEGWFKLRNGEKALVFVSEKSRVAYIPTRKGYSVLLSVAEPEMLLSALRK